MHKKIFLSLIVLVLSSCKQQQKFTNFKNITPDTPLTIFIHGTLFNSATAMLVHAIDCPFGLNCAQAQGNKYLMGRIPYILNDASSKDFPLDNFYLFGWSGKLSFDERKKAAFDLYQSIKNYRGKITIIGHSHGCNVAMHLAQIAQDDNNQNFCIDRLILLAGPVQHVTEIYIQSPAFKKIYSFYSTADITQVADPQGLYKETKKVNTGKQINFFSNRTFEFNPKLSQIRVLFNGCSISHIDFILESFIKKLPKIIETVDAIDNKHPCYNTQQFYTVNIRSGNKETQFLTPAQAARPFVPRQHKRSL